MSTKFGTAILFFQFIFLQRFTVGNECHREGEFVKVEPDGLPQINSLKVTTSTESSFCSVECLNYPGCNSFAYLTYTSSDNCLLSSTADGESVSGGSASGVVEVYKKVVSAVAKRCDPNPCKNGGTCMYTCEEPYYHCVCPEGTSGKECEPVFYPFQATFTNLGGTGRFGPTTIGNRYNGQYHENMVTLQNGVQLFTVPYTGMYTITAVGAAGGFGSSGSTYRGKGAKIGGDFDLVKGQVLQILVGQAGLNNAPQHSSGGGGGTFVVTSSGAPLIIAGGGGGIHGPISELVSAHASVGSIGKSGYGGPVFSGGTSGNGASDSGQSTYDGGGGGGFYTSGKSSPGGGAGGNGFAQGGNGGASVQYSAYGGFGGGGGGYGSGGGCGGGGGYSGGASGNNYGNSCGGGGGSYNSAKQNIFKTAAYGIGHGYVIIKRIPL